MSATPSRWAKLGLVAFALLAAVGVCSLRITSLQTDRDEAVATAIEKLARALKAHGTEGSTGFDEARTAATEAARVSSALMDPYPSFVLQAVEELQAASTAEEPEPVALPEERARWLATHGRVDDAITLLEHTLDAMPQGDLRRERLALSRRLYQAMAAVPDP